MPHFCIRVFFFYVFFSLVCRPLFPVPIKLFFFSHLAFTFWTTPYSPTLMHYMVLFNWWYKVQIACHNTFFSPCLSTECVPIFLKVQSIVSCVQWPAFQFPARNALLSGLIDRPFHIICLFRQNPSRGLLQFSFFFFFKTNFSCFFLFLFQISNSRSLCLFILGTLLLTWHYLLSLREGNQKNR